MAAGKQYRDPIIETILTKLKAAQLKGIKGYFNGDVVVPAKSDMPLVYVAKDTTQISSADTQEDQHVMPMVATVIFDITQDMGRSYDMVAGAGGLYEVVEGRNDDFSLKTNTLLYALRANQVLGTKLWLSVNSNITVNYGIGINRRGPGTFSVEAVVHFTVVLHTPTPNL